MNSEKQNIMVGISSCLLGQKVRFDGNHKYKKFINDELGKLFEFVPICPEVAIGMGVPRRPIRLANDANNPRALGVNDASLDFTNQLVTYAKHKATELDCLSGYIFKKGSPSCGMERVKVFRGKDIISTNGIGLYAKEIMKSNPLLPVEEEGRLMDKGLKGNFVQRVIVYHRWQKLQASGLTIKNLVEFHTRHKFILLAHDEKTYRNLGRLIANLSNSDLPNIAEKYITNLMNGLKKLSSRERHTNVLQHIMGFLKRHISADDKQELCGIINDYRTGELSLDVPITLLRHHFRRLPFTYIKQQFYLYDSQSV